MHLFRIIVLLLVFCLRMGAQGHKAGVKIDHAKYSKTPLSVPLIRGGTYDELPSSHSLKQFTPTPSDQGDYSTGPAWAAAYEAFTCMKAVEKKISNRRTIDSMSFSPSFVYNLAKDSTDTKCEAPICIETALDVMAKYGSARLADYPYDCINLISDEQKRMAEHFKISGYRRLFETGGADKQYYVKKSLAENKPVVVGIYVPASLAFAEDIEIWKPDKSELGRAFGREDSAQAMTVIGYDDYKDRGAFELMNSWGTDWGSNGYIWIRYEDFERFCFSAYQMTVDPSYEPKEMGPEKIDPEGTTISGTMKFLLPSGDEMKTTFRGGIYFFSDQYPSGTKFNIQVRTRKEGYIYAIASDKVHSEISQIFPKRNYSPNFASMSTFFIPGPFATDYSALDNTVGIDYYCVIFSRRNLNFDLILTDMRKATGDFYTRVRTVLRDNLIPWDKTSYSPDGTIDFSAKYAEKTVLPVFVELQHVAGEKARH